MPTRSGVIALDYLWGQSPRSRAAPWWGSRRVWRCKPGAKRSGTAKARWGRSPHPRPKGTGNRPLIPPQEGLGRCPSGRELKGRLPVREAGAEGDGRRPTGVPAKAGRSETLPQAMPRPSLRSPPQGGRSATARENRRFSGWSVTQCRTLSHAACHDNVTLNRTPGATVQDTLSKQHQSIPIKNPFGTDKST